MSPIPSKDSLQVAIKAFTSSSTPFRIIYSLPASAKPGTISTLFVLDSSFNPPTKAHEYLVQQALSRARGQDSTSKAKQARVLLLLSTKNADKPSSPASTADRLKMMILFAKGIWESLAGSSEPLKSTTSGETPTSPTSGVDIALSTEPYFLEKSLSLNKPGPENRYLNADDWNGLAQWHLLGFDTLIRLLDVKYYPPDHSLKVLRPLFEKEGNRILVVKRDDSGDEQDDYVNKLNVNREEHGFDAPGWNISWASSIELVEPFAGAQGQDMRIVSVSSTAVRQAAGKKDDDALNKMVSKSISDYILHEKLYTE